MLTDKIQKSIISFVSIKPRTVQEVAQFIHANWRTADRYIEKIAEETGSIASRTFREGTRGALKIVFALNANVSGTEFQERLLQRILQGRTKDDFSPFDIYQYVDEHKRKAFIELQGEVNIEQDIVKLLRSAKESILIFSGNLSWANAIQGKTKVVDVLAETAERIPVKVLTRVDIASLKNISKVLHINESLGRHAIEMRHAEQPLRCIVVDGVQARFKEEKIPEVYRKGELDEKTSIFYDILDEEWVEWIRKGFWKMFSTAVPAERRIKTLESIKKAKVI